MHSGREHQCRDRRCNSRGGSDEELTRSRGDRIGYGREGRVRTGDQPMLCRRRGEMGNNMLDGLGSGLRGDTGSRGGDRSLGGGLGGRPGSGIPGGLGGGLPRNPMFARGYESRGSPSLDPRMPYMGEDMAARRRNALLQNGLGPRGFSSEERLLGGRAAMMGGGLDGGMGGLGGMRDGFGSPLRGGLGGGPGSPLGGGLGGMGAGLGRPLGAGLGGGLGGQMGGGLGGMGGGLSPLGGGMSPMRGSPHNSPPGNIFDAQQMDRQRMPYGPPAHGGGMGNYRQPYMEDYESELSDAEIMERAMMEREFIGPRDGYGYGDGGGLGGQQFGY